MKPNATPFSMPFNPVAISTRSPTAGLPETIQPRDAVHVTRPSMGVNT